MGGSGLDRTDDFQKFCRSGLNQIQLLWIRIGLGLKNFTVRSSLAHSTVAVGTVMENSRAAPQPCRGRAQK